MPAASTASSAPTALDRDLLRLAAVVVLGTIMSILDVTIVNVAIPVLAEDFDASVASIQWVATGYMLALAAVIPLTGWATDRFGGRRVWMTSITLFVLGSGLCALAWSEESLIFFRVLQGIGGGMVMPVGQTLLTRAAGPQRIGRVMSVIGVPMLLGPVLGPVIGGFLVETVSWQSIFLVNLPIGALALVLAWRVLPHDNPQPQQRLDVLGACLLPPGLAAFVYGLAETNRPDGFADPHVLVGLGVGLVLMGAFVAHARRHPNPLIDLRLFSDRTFSASAATTFMLGISLFGAMLLIPLYYQGVRGLSALDAGLLLAPQGLGAALAMPLAGRLVDRTGAGKIVPWGVVIVSLGTLAFCFLSPHTSYWLLGGALLVRGIGMGLAMMPAMSAAYQTLSHAAVAKASSTLNIIQRVGGAIGTAVLAVILAGQIPGAAIAAEGLARLPEGAREQALGQASTGFAHTFVWAFVLGVLALAPTLLLPRTKPEVASSAEPALVEA